MFARTAALPRPEKGWERRIHDLSRVAIAGMSQQKGVAGRNAVAGTESAAK